MAKTQARLYKIVNHGGVMADIIRKLIDSGNKLAGNTLSEIDRRDAQKEFEDVKLFILANMSGQAIRLIYAYNQWQGTEFVAREDYSCEVCKTAEAIELSKQGIEVEYAVKKDAASV